MKRIGYADNNGVIVEMTEGEWRTLHELDRRINGRAYGGATVRIVDFGEMSPAFQAVAAWLDASFTAGQLQDIVNALKVTLGEKVETWEADS
jgi:hypothetical protein